MSLNYTESFFAFGRYNGSDAFDAAPGAGNEARNNFNLALQRAGYNTFMPANTSNDTSGGLVVRPDPIYPERNVLVHSSNAGPTVNLGVSAAFRKPMPVTDKQIIVGFSLYVPAEYVANVGNSTVPVFRMVAALQADANWYVAATVLNAAKEVFRITNDLSIRWGTDATQSSRKLRAGQLNYIEVRIDATAVNVWIDDTLVMIKQVSLITQTLGMVFENNVNSGAGGTNMSGAPGRWAMGNMYWMIVDGIAPQQRLGNSTRVIGSRPDADVDVRFVRPIAAPTNASVAAQDIVDAPAQQLQSTTVGDFDTYSTATAGASSEAVRSMGMVHAVGVKVLAANLEADIHRIKPYTKYNTSGEGADVKSRDLAILTGLPFSRTVRAMGIRPTDKCIFVVGDGEMIYRSGPNCDINNWTKISDTGAARYFASMWFRSDGGVLFGGSAVNGAVNGTGLLSWLPPGTDSLALPLVGTAGVSGNVIGWGMAPDGSKLMGFSGTATITRVITATPAIYNSAAPHTATWAASNPGLTPDNAAGGAAMLTKPDGSQIMALQLLATDFAYVNSNAAVTSWTARAHGDTGVAYGALGYDGAAWLIGSSISGGLNGSPQIRRSLDASTFTPATGFGNALAGANAILRGFASNQATQESMAFGDGGCMAMTMDGINWRQLPRLTTQPLYAGVCMTDGNFLIGGGAGTMLRTITPTTDTSLLPLAGYSMAFGSAVFNPGTGQPWTPAEASNALFGVRLTT